MPRLTVQSWQESLCTCMNPEPAGLEERPPTPTFSSHLKRSVDTRRPKAAHKWLPNMCPTSSKTGTLKRSLMKWLGIKLSNCPTKVGIKGNELFLAWCSKKTKQRSKLINKATMQDISPRHPNQKFLYTVTNITPKESDTPFLYKKYPKE